GSRSSTCGWNLVRARMKDGPLVPLLILGVLLLLAVARDHDALTRGQRLARHDGFDLFTSERLALQQRLGDGVEPVAVLLDDLSRAVVLRRDEAADLVVDLLGGLVAVLFVEAGSEEARLFALDVGERAELVAHAPLGDHGARELRRLLEV